MPTLTPRSHHRLASGLHSSGNKPVVKEQDNAAQWEDTKVETSPTSAMDAEVYDDGPYDDGGPMYYDDDDDDDDKAMAQEGALPNDVQQPARAEGHENTEAAVSFKTPARLNPDEKVTTDITPSTAVPVAGWQRIYEGDGDTNDEENHDCNEEAGTGDEPWSDDGTLKVEPESQNLPFYLLDAHEESAQPGVVYLFGKIAAGENSKSYVSCCAIVKGMSRTLFFVPKEAISSPEISELHAAAQENKTPETKKPLLAALHAAFGTVKSEVRGIFTKHSINQMTMKPVLRQYAFENQKLLHGKQWVLKVRYPASLPVLPLGLSGDTFSTVFGTNQSCLEALILKRRIMGPSWIAIHRPRRIDPGAQVSYCRVEVEVQGHKSVFNAASLDQGSRPAPPLTVAAVHLKTMINPNTAANEVVAASVVYLPRVETDGPASFRNSDLRHFSAVRKLDGLPFPIGFDNEVKKANVSDTGRRNGGAMLAMQPNERALLTMLVVRLKDLDADVYVGHNFAAYDLDVLLHRMQALKVPHWASLGRLKRSKFPNLGGGGHVYG
jgi:DNA polymerase alpha subunit A